jgi:hypothetical protein
MERGDTVVATNSAGVVLRGKITSIVFHGGSHLIELDLAGTTSSIVVDEADFEWVQS